MKCDTLKSNLWTKENHLEFLNSKSSFVTHNFLVNTSVTTVSIQSAAVSVLHLHKVLMAKQ